MLGNLKLNLGFLFFWLGCFLAVPVGSCAKEKDKEIPDFKHFGQTVFDSVSFYCDIKEPTMAIKWAMKGLSAVRGVPENHEPKEDIHSITARALTLLGARSEASYHLHQAIFHRLKYIERPDFVISRKYGSIGSNFIIAEQRDSSLKNFRIAEHLLRKMNYPVLHSSSWNNLGMAYAHFGQLDSAIVCYDNAIDILKRGTDGQNPFYFVILENRAAVEEKLGNYLVAIDLLKESIYNNTSREINMIKSRYSSCRRLIELKVATGQTENIAFDCSRFFNSLQYVRDPIKKFTSVLAVLDVEIEYGLKAELLAKDLRTAYSDSLITELRAQNRARITALNEYERSILSQQKEISKLELTKKEQEIQFAKNQASQNIIYLLGLLALVGVLSAMVWVSSRKKHERLILEREMSHLELENQKLAEQRLSKELEMKKGDLMDLAIYNVKKQEWSNDILAKLKGVKGKEEKELNKLIRQIELDMGQQRPTEDRLQVVHSNIDKVNQEFYTKVNSIFPSLTQGERELCGFLRLRLSGKEIAQIRNVSPQAVTKAKQRLRKKIEMGPDGDLYGYFETI